MSLDPANNPLDYFESLYCNSGYFQSRQTSIFWAFPTLLAPGTVTFCSESAGTREGLGPNDTSGRGKKSMT